MGGPIDGNDPMHTLYYAPGAASLLVHWLLIDRDVPHRIRRVDLDAREQKRHDDLALGPALVRRAVPARGPGGMGLTAPLG